ncbi:NADP-dependent oxidoreductase [Rhizobium sp. FKY42]|uniref:MDR family NADP-dependent oxidoreductase n=1 Tax=Rhizobium sp. FKY42 TaxID=2562310 RepID=UPI00197EF393|nr:NADP-dependent oxidoreductase [Rhizobium sp. FKY42]
MSMSLEVPATVNRQWVLKRRPVGPVSRADFNYVEGKPPTQLDEGDVLVRALYFGFDASQRIWLTEDGGYMDPIMPGEVMKSMGIGQVVESRHPDYKPGQMVEGFMSWQDYPIMRADGPMPLRILPPADYPLSWNLGIFGVGGLTAYFGVTAGLNVTAGETVVISAATGATGNLACQIAKLKGAKVIGIAGGAAKCRWVLENTGADHCVDYRAPDYIEQIRALAPDGVNAYFDNVGGEMLNEMIMLMAPRGRILICGAMSQGYEDTRCEGPSNYMQMVNNHLTMVGIHLFFYADQIPAAAQQLGQWTMEGKLRALENHQEGFEKAPDLLPTMFTGKDPGKLVLKIAEPH